MLDPQSTPYKLQAHIISLNFLSRYFLLNSQLQVEFEFRTLTAVQWGVKLSWQLCLLGDEIYIVKVVYGLTHWY